MKCNASYTLYIHKKIMKCNNSYLMIFKGTSNDIEIVWKFIHNESMTKSNVHKFYFYFIKLFDMFWEIDVYRKSDCQGIRTLN